MKKVIVIGCPKSGKTTFSKELSEITNIEFIELDHLEHPSSGETLMLDELKNVIKKEMKKRSWIMDGNYLSTMAMRIKECDTIIWLDYPVDICLANAHALKEEGLDEYIVNFPKTNRPKILRRIAKAKRNNKEIHIFKDPQEARLFLDHLKQELSIKRCKKCGVELEEGTKGKYCPECKQKRIQILRGAAMVSLPIMASLGGIVLYKNRKHSED